LTLDETNVSSGDGALTISNTLGTETDLVTAEKTGLELDLRKFETMSLDVLLNDIDKFTYGAGSQNSPLILTIGQGSWDKVVTVNMMPTPSEYQWGNGSGDIETNEVVGWNVMKWHKDDFAVTGEILWDMPFDRIKIEARTAGNGVASMTVDRLRINDDQEPAIILMFDDGALSTYSKAYEYIKDKDVKISTSAVESFVGTEGVYNDEDFCTLAQLQEMHNSGKVAITNHTLTHADLTILTKEQAKAEIGGMRDWIVDNNMAGEEDILVCPGNRNNPTALEAMQEEGVKIARTSGRTYMHNPLLRNPLHLGFVASPTHLTPVQLLKDIVDSMIKYKVVGNIMLHYIGDTANSMYITESQWQAWADYIISKGLETITFGDFYDKYL
jgi:peptidoglycan/xylan/chitin deacetylase (PgdA/CDA1 family)